MTIKIYVNWDEGEILTEKEYENFKKDRVADTLADEYDREEYINNYCRDIKNLTCADILFMNNEDLRELQDCATEYLAECVGEELDKCFKLVVLEV